MQELAADAAVQADAACHVVHVGADFLAQIGHFVDEGDLHRQEGVGGVFGQFGGFDGGEDDGGLDQVQRPVEAAHHLPGAIGFGTDDHTVWAHEVADRVAFAQEFRVGCDVEPQVRAGGADDLLDAAAGAYGDGGFGDDHRVAGQCPSYLFRCRIDIGQVGVAVTAPCGRADGDEHRLGAVERRGQVVGEREPAGLDVFPHQLFQAGFVDRHPAFAQRGELDDVGFHHRDLGAEFREAGAGHQADIAAANHRYTHLPGSLCRRGADSAQDGRRFQRHYAPKIQPFMTFVVPQRSLGS